MTEFAAEAYATVVDEIKPLLERHYEEIAVHKQFPLQPDWARYEAVARLGKLVIVTARHGKNLVGYAVFLVSQHLHYTTQRLAANDVIFIDKPYRLGSAGIRLIAESERILAGAGVNKVMWHVKPLHNWGPILERRGYGTEEIIMAKILKEPTWQE
jgi:hypothetical protein